MQVNYKLKNIAQNFYKTIEFHYKLCLIEFHFMCFKLCDLFWNHNEYILEHVRLFQWMKSILYT